MQSIVLLSLLIWGLAQPAVAAQRGGRGGQAPARGGIAVTVTDPGGAVIPGVNVELTGPATRDGQTDAAGQISFPGLAAGTYRLRFSGDEVTTFEREVTLPAGRSDKFTIVLNRATERPAEAPPPPPAAPAVGPIGEPQLGSLSRLAERERDAKDGREILLSCSGNTRNMLVVLPGEQPQRIYESAEATYYVISGDGSAKVGDLESVVGAGTFIAVPRGTPFSLARRGNRALAMLWTLSGEPCETSR